MPNILIAFHFPTNTGYAIEPLEIAFYEAASEYLNDRGCIHLAYSSLSGGRPGWLQEPAVKLVELQYRGMDSTERTRVAEYIKANEIEWVLAFDLSVSAEICKLFREAGVKRIVSYWGAPMSSLNSSFKLALKKIEVALNRSKPDHFVFESYGMRDTAINGRGVATGATSVVRLGIDAERYSESYDPDYVYREFGIPRQRKIFFYAGHMEERKGVAVILNAAVSLVKKRGFKDAHFLLCGNKEGEVEQFYQIYKETEADNYVTFAGYRQDIPQLMAGCYAGIIASTGWDSFPRTSLEMAVAGLPLLVSNLPGLNETIIDNETGFLFQPGDAEMLADRIEKLVSEDAARSLMGEKARQRIKNEFTLEVQKNNLIALFEAQYPFS